MKQFVSLCMLLPALTFGCSNGGTSSSAPADSRPAAKITAADTVRTGAAVLLDGSASADADGSALRFTWTLAAKPAGSAASLSNADAATSSFTADVPGDYTVTLTVSDRTLTSAPDTAKITALTYSGTEIFVSAANTQSGSGTKENPFRAIQAAVDFASAGDLIKAAAGTYSESVVIPGGKGVLLLGGHSADFSHRDASANITRIHGSGTGAVVSMEYSGGYGEHQLVRIDGFTIDGGNRGLSIVSIGNGGALDAEIADNIIENNSGLTGNNDYGGGILCRGVVPVITKNVIRSNQCGRGAGLAVDLRDASEQVLIDGNTIENNTGHYDHGGGVYLAARKGSFSNNIVRGNRVGETVGYGWGGGMIVDGGAGTDFSSAVYLTLTGNVFSGNYAPSIGGGLFIDEGANVLLSRELIVKNSIGAADKGGAGLYVDGPRGTTEAKTVLSYCTVADNTGPDGSAGNAVYIEGESAAEADHCIFWNNRSCSASDFFVLTGSSFTVSDSTYQTGMTGGGSFSASDCAGNDPEFADAAAGDYHSALPDRGIYGK